MSWRAALLGKSFLAATALMAVILAAGVSTPAVSKGLDPTVLTHEYLYVEVCRVKTNRILTTTDHTDLNHLPRYDVYPRGGEVSHRFYYDRALERELKVGGAIVYHVWLNASRETKSLPTADVVFTVYDVSPDGDHRVVHEDKFRVRVEEELREYVLTGKEFEYVFERGHTVCVEVMMSAAHGDVYMYYDWVEAPSYMELPAEEEFKRMTFEYVDAEVNGVRTERILTHPDYTNLDHEPHEDLYSPPETAYRFYLYGPLVEDYRMDGPILYHLWIGADREGRCAIVMRVYDVDESGVREPVHEDVFELHVREGVNLYELKGEWATHDFKAGHTICVEFVMTHMEDSYTFLYDCKKTHSYVDMPGVVVPELCVPLIAVAPLVPLAVAAVRRLRRPHTSPNFLGKGAVRGVGRDGC